MNALVVYESLYGNTARIAEAIGSGLAGAGLVVTVAGLGSGSVDGTAIEEADLLVVGGPTHAHVLSSASSRASWCSAGCTRSIRAARSNRPING